MKLNLLVGRTRSRLRYSESKNLHWAEPHKRTYISSLIIYFSLENRMNEITIIQQNAISDTS